MDKKFIERICEITNSSDYELALKDFKYIGSCDFKSDEYKSLILNGDYYVRCLCGQRIKEVFFLMYNEKTYNIGCECIKKYFKGVDLWLQIKHEKDILKRIEKRFTFGKHKGEKIKDVKISYLQWVHTDIPKYRNDKFKACVDYLMKANNCWC